MANAVASTGPQSVQNIVSIPLADIVVPTGFNIRSGDFTKGEGDESLHGFGQLVESLKELGQTDAVDVRPLKGGKFQLVTGFRRYAALTELAKQRKEPGIILAIIHPDMTDSEAITRNAEENIAREDISPADRAWALRRLKDASVADKTHKSDRAMFSKLGLNQVNASRLLKIAENVIPDVFRHWREDAKVKLGILQMVEVSKLERSKQMEKYRELMGGDATEESTGAGNKLTPEQKTLNRAIADAERFAAVLGQLAYVEALEVTEDIWNVVKDEVCCVSYMTKVPDEKLTMSKWKKVAKKARAAYEEAMRLAANPEPEAEEEEEEEEE